MKSAIAALGALALTYCAIGFIAWDFNAENWTVDGRFMAVVLGGLFAVVAAQIFRRL